MLFEVANFKKHKMIRGIFKSTHHDLQKGQSKMQNDKTEHTKRQDFQILGQRDRD